MTEKPTFLIKFYDEREPEKFGIGEAAVFPGLSPEVDGNYVNKLIELMANVALGKETDLSRHSSIQFGLEQAILDYSNGCEQIYFNNKFSRGKEDIMINGLVWMGDYEIMIERLEKKIKEGFQCVKLKIGAINWEKELSLIKSVRDRFSSEILTIRLDANGAFTPANVMDKLYQLAPYDIHSLEQPIKASQPEEMRKICKESPIPIALDEELIGKYSEKDKIETLEKIKPQYIILKPALCGGFSGASEWIKSARETDTGWWVTSALESNIGLNAIAQWTFNSEAKGAQGLGTGEVFTNNFSTRVERVGEFLHYNVNKPIDYSQFDNLNWHS